MPFSDYIPNTAWDIVGAGSRAHKEINADGFPASLVQGRYLMALDAMQTNALHFISYF